jgi:hypothetical protein
VAAGARVSSPHDAARGVQPPLPRTPETDRQRAMVAWPLCDGDGAPAIASGAWRRATPGKETPVRGSAVGPGGGQRQSPDNGDRHGGWGGVKAGDVRVGSTWLEASAAADGIPGPVAEATAWCPRPYLAWSHARHHRPCDLAAQATGVVSPARPLQRRSSHVSFFSKKRKTTYWSEGSNCGRVCGRGRGRVWARA